MQFHFHPFQLSFWMTAIHKARLFDWQMRLERKAENSTSLFSNITLKQLALVKLKYASTISNTGEDDFQ